MYEEESSMCLEILLDEFERAFPWLHEDLSAFGLFLRKVKRWYDEKSRIPEEAEYVGAEHFAVH